MGDPVQGAGSLDAGLVGTTVIGGLIRTNESSVETGVPWLKDIPLVGNLFKSSNIVQEERELLIFVTPKILREGVSVY